MADTFYQQEEYPGPITEVWAYVIINPQNETESLIAVRDKDHTLPLLAGSQDRIKVIQEFLPQLVQEARKLGQYIKLVRFSNRQEIETYK